MDIEIIGPWILLGVGVIVLLGAVAGTLLGKAAKTLALMWIFGGLLSGVGVYGPGFLASYSQFLRVMSPMVETPTDATYSAVLSRIGRGNLRPEHQEIALAYVLDRPLPDMEALLDDAIAEATDESGQAALTAARRALQGQHEVAHHLAEEIRTSQASAQVIDRFDPTTQSLVARELTKQPPETPGPLPRETVLRLQQLAQPRAVRTPVPGIRFQQLPGSEDRRTE